MDVTNERSCAAWTVWIFLDDIGKARAGGLEGSAPSGVYDIALRNQGARETDLYPHHACQEYLPNFANLQHMHAAQIFEHQMAVPNLTIDQELASRRMRSFIDCASTCSHIVDHKLHEMKELKCL